MTCENKAAQIGKPSLWNVKGASHPTSPFPLRLDTMPARSCPRPGALWPGGLSCAGYMYICRSFTGIHPRFSLKDSCHPVIRSLRRSELSTPRRLVSYCLDTASDRFRDRSAKSADRPSPAFCNAPAPFRPIPVRPRTDRSQARPCVSPLHAAFRKSTALPGARSEAPIGSHRLDAHL